MRFSIKISLITTLIILIISLIYYFFIKDTFSISYEKVLLTGASSSCNLINEDSQIQILTKGVKFFSKTTKINNTGYTISDGTYIYMWTNENNRGLKILLSEEKTNNSLEKSFIDQNSFKSLLKSGYKISCYRRFVPNSTFYPPTNINFINPTFQAN